MLYLQQVQQFSVALLWHCPTLFYCPPCLPHHQLRVAGRAVEVPVLEPRDEASTGQLSESLQASCSSTRWEVRVQLDDRYPLLLLFENSKRVRKILWLYLVCSKALNLSLLAFQARHISLI